MARKQSAELERKKFFSDPILVSMIVVLLVFLALFILYPLLMLLVDSFYSEGKITLEVFGRVLSLERFQKAFKNTLVLGMITGIASTAIGLLFAYVEVYVKLKTKVLEKLFCHGFHASRCFSSFCAVSVHDYAVRTKRHHHPLPFWESMIPMYMGLRESPLCRH